MRYFKFLGFFIWVMKHSNLGRRVWIFDLFFLRCHEVEIIRLFEVHVIKNPMSFPLLIRTSFFSVKIVIFPDRQRVQVLHLWSDRRCELICSFLLTVEVSSHALEQVISCWLIFQVLLLLLLFFKLNIYLNFISFFKWILGFFKVL